MAFREHDPTPCFDKVFAEGCQIRSLSSVCIGDHRGFSLAFLNSQHLHGNGVEKGRVNDFMKSTRPFFYFNFKYSKLANITPPISIPKGQAREVRVYSRNNF